MHIGRSIGAVAGALLALGISDRVEADDVSTAVYSDVKSVLEDVITAQASEDIANYAECIPALDAYYHRSIERIRNRLWGSITGTLKSDTVALATDVVWWSIAEMEAAREPALKRFIAEAGVRDIVFAGVCVSGHRNALPDGSRLPTLVEEKCGATQPATLACASARMAEALLRGEPEVAKGSVRDMIPLIISSLDGSTGGKYVAVPAELRDWIRAVLSGAEKPASLLESKLHKYFDDVSMVLDQAAVSCKSPPSDASSLAKELASANPAWLCVASDVNAIAPELTATLTVTGTTPVMMKLSKSQFIRLASSTSALQELLDTIACGSPSKISGPATCVDGALTIDPQKAPSAKLDLAFVDETTVPATVSFTQSASGTLTSDASGRVVGMTGAGVQPMDLARVVLGVGRAKAFRAKFDSFFADVSVSLKKLSAAEFVASTRALVRFHDFSEDLGPIWDLIASGNTKSGERVVEAARAILDIAYRRWCPSTAPRPAACSRVERITTLLRDHKQTARVVFDAVSAGDYRSAAVTILREELTEDGTSAGSDPTSEPCDKVKGRFVLNFASYVLDDHSNDTAQSVARAAFRSSAVQALRCIQGAGVDRSTGWEWPVHTAPIASGWDPIPVASLRFAWNQNYLNETSDTGLRYVVTIDWPALRFRVSPKSSSMYLAVQATPFDLLAPVREIALRKKSGFRYQDYSGWAELVHPRLDLVLGYTSMSTHILAVAGLAMRYQVADYRNSLPVEDSTDRLVSYETSDMSSSDRIEASLGVAYVF